MIANRIDQGFNIEVRAEPFEDIEDDIEISPDEEQVREYVDRIVEASEVLQFMEIEGCQLLHLPEKTEKATKPRTMKKKA